MKRIMFAFIAGAFLLTPLGMQSAWGKGHVKLGSVQVCVGGATRTISERALQRALGNGACRLPTCDTANAPFFNGDPCSQVAGGFCPLGMAVVPATSPLCVNPY